MPSPTSPSRSLLSLEAQWHQFARNRFLAMPLAGTLAWAVVGIAGLMLPTGAAALVLFGATGSIFYLGLGVAKLTGEDLLGRTRQGNFYDRIFLLTVIMACLVYAVAIPFFLIEPTSLPLTVGILTGLMWVPFSGLLRHWIGLFHGVTRTVLIVAAWYVWPEHRFVSIPLVIIAIYAVTIIVLERRFRALAVDAAAPDAATV